jgi:hypothetical protein
MGAGWHLGERAWRNLPTLLDQQAKLEWARTFLDGTRAPPTASRGSRARTRRRCRPGPRAPRRRSGRREEVAATERVVAADADDQVRRVRRQVPELLAPAHGRAPVDGQERRSRAVRQPLPHLPDDAEGPAAT